MSAAVRSLERLPCAALGSAEVREVPAPQALPELVLVEVEPPQEAVAL